MRKNDFLREHLHTAFLKWNLAGIASVYERRQNGVYYAVSDEYGPVVLKVHNNCDSLSREYRTLMEMQGESCARAYAFDGINGLLLEKRILPGTTLKEEPDREKRLASFVQVFEAIHTVPEIRSDYPSYLNWVRDACKTVSHSGNRELSEGMLRAVAIAEKMFEKYSERMLLHGDLHHDNILKDESGNYRIIDPKGVVGPLVFDIPRFVLNEMDDTEDSLRKVHIDRVIETLSRQLEYPSDDLYQLFFMEIMLANAWCFEAGEEIDENDLKFAVSMMK